jgi:hypothetical protein
MRLSTRLLLTALAALAFVAVAALYLGYRNGEIAGQSLFEVATTGDLRGLFPSHDSPDSAIADLALQRLETVYYKPIAPQTPLSGERDALTSLLNAKKIGNSALPAQTAAGDEIEDGERAAELLAVERSRRSYRCGTSRNDELRSRPIYRLFLAA